MGTTIDSTFNETPAKVQEIKGWAHLQNGSLLTVLVSSVSFDKPCATSSKAIPIVVSLREERTNTPLGIPTIDHKDIYSFDHNGTLLIHGYTIIVGGVVTFNEAHDRDVSRLDKYKDEIAAIVGSANAYGLVGRTRIVTCLKNRCVKEHYDSLDGERTANFP